MNTEKIVYFGDETQALFDRVKECKERSNAALNNIKRWRVAAQPNSPKMNQFTRTAEDAQQNYMDALQDLLENIVNTIVSITEKTGGTDAKRNRLREKRPSIQVSKEENTESEKEDQEIAKRILEETNHASNS